MKECAIVGEFTATAPAPLTKQKRASPAPVPSHNIGQYVDILPANISTDVFADLTYAVEVLNDRGHSAGISNQVRVPAAPTVAPPQNLAAQLTAEGVVLTWTSISPTPRMNGLQYVYRIYRREKDAQSGAIAGEVPVDISRPVFIDRNFEWEKQYSYHVAVVTIVERGSQREEIEGDDSPAVTVFTHDVFPPPVPSGLQAVAEQQNQKLSIDLTWNPVQQNDLAGYNIYRREEGGAVSKINSDLVKLPAFRDQQVVPGKTYFYSVSAVDVRGNESPHSAEAGESVH